MQSGRILIMRHAEKTGDLEDPHLSEAGRQRALRLVTYIPQEFEKPSYLFATAESKHSRRPIETLEPLSADIKVALDTSFADQDYGALAHHLLKNNRYEQVLTVVCWHHGNIPNMAYALGLPDGSYPEAWDRKVFNLILDITFANGAPSVKQMIEPF
ncbi:phosphoglycerate mutase family protein [Bradyrhizobium oligotrophicum]|uniref:phosphoglycerate mutase family protein n=1 Tax=Bradyrhizobium oligotrophicum TaxID=44255 RepID=UPI003EBB04F9